MRRLLLSGGAAVGLASATMLVATVLMAPERAAACGGFFCGRQPVDQQAERIVFAMNPNGSVDMIVQIAYQGTAADFAWVLPLGAVPEAGSLDVFPQRALVALDANTGPQFQMPDDCFLWDADASAGPPSAGGMGPRSDEGEVTVHIREEVGPFDVAVVESEDPAALVSWLRDNGFRVTTPMEPYIRVYTSEGKKFLALRLQPGEDVDSIQPFRFTLPGEAASIPIRMTAIAAEPEMGITVFLLGDMRYGGANWPDVTIDDNQIVWRPYTWPQETNWTALVARGVDEAGGRGWVTEMAGPTAPYAELARSTTPPDEESQAAQEALLPLLEGNPYITRLYTRLAPEEMTLDPVFRRTGGADVSNVRRLPRYVDGRDLCESPGGPVGGEDSAVTPCDFATCGAGGLCRVVSGEVMGGAGTPDVAGCACVPGTTARTTFDPSGRPAVSCVDTRMSFLNPGDREVPGADPLPDACVGVSCGEGSECVAMNMTPTCICAIGMVAVGSIDASGVRQTRCVAPREPVPVDFYTLRVPGLPIDLPGGRPSMELPGAPPPRDTSSDGGGCSAAGNTDAGSMGLGVLALAALALVRSRRRRS